MDNRQQLNLIKILMLIQILHEDMQPNYYYFQIFLIFALFHILILIVKNLEQ
jgi:hypothetical protein